MKPDDRMHTRLRTERGSILIFTYFVATALVAWEATALQSTLTQVRSTSTYVDSTQAFHLAEGGYEYGLDWMRNLPAPPIGTISFDPVTGLPGCSTNNPAATASAQNIGAGQFSVCIDPDDDNPTAYRDVFTLAIAGQTTNGQASRLLTAVLRSESFSRYAYFTDSEELVWNGKLYNVWFTGNDVISGPVHSNDQFNISGDPVFHGMVTSAAGSINYYHGGPPDDNPAFNGGLTLGAEDITLPLSATKLRVAAISAGGAWYEGNTTIVLHPDGTMFVTNADAGLTDAPIPQPDNGAVFVNGGNVTVSGELDGQLTIGSSDDIIVADSLRYRCDPQDPEADADCLDAAGEVANNDDILGLVAEQNVVVSKDTPNNVTIQASVMGLNSSFTVERWWDTNYKKGTLTVYGGIIQDSRGAVGTFYSSSGAKRSGYSKDYYYDIRLSNMAPPFYPTTMEFEELVWREQ